MADLVRRWDELVRADVEPGERLTGTAASQGSVLRPPATEAQILEAEARLGARLPESYREFLLVSNGAFADTQGACLDHSFEGESEGASGGYSLVGIGFLPVQELAWLRDRNPEYAKLMAETVDYFGDERRVLADGAAMPSWAPVADGLIVVPDRHPGQSVLVPMDDEEWGLWTHWKEDGTAFRSFRSFLEHEVQDREPLNLSLSEVAALLQPGPDAWRGNKRIKRVVNPDAVPLLAEVLLRPDVVPSDEWTRRAVAEALGRIGGEEAIAALVRVGDRAAARGLLLAGTPAARDALVAMGDYAALAALDDPRAPGLAAEALPGLDPTGSALRTALVAMRKSDDSRYVPLLQSVFESARDWNGRIDLAYTIGVLDPAAGIARMREILADPKLHSGYGVEGMVDILERRQLRDGSS